MLQILEPPRPCAYLPKQRASLEITLDPFISAQQYGELLRRGYRRFGWQIFRPQCPACRACISIRVLTQNFHAGAGDRRVIRQNESVYCELAPAETTSRHVDLYNRYQQFMHRERGWGLQQHTADSYQDAFVSGPPGIGWEWRYYDAGQLIGVSLMDVTPGAISLVYFFYDPAWRPRSPGRFSILNQLQFAAREAIPHAYLGYWVKDCGSLNYKNRFRPYEILEAYVPVPDEPNWLPGPLN